MNRKIKWVAAVWASVLPGAMLFAACSDDDNGGTATPRNDAGARDTGTSRPDTGAQLDTGTPDTGSTPDTGARPDTGAQPDTGVEAGPSIDYGSNCEKLGYGADAGVGPGADGGKCAANEFCAVYYDGQLSPSRETVACVSRDRSPAPGLTAGSPCVEPLAGECKDGLACAGSRQPFGYSCQQTCNAATDCTDPKFPFCNNAFGWATGFLPPNQVKACGTCDYKVAGECGEGMGCQVAGATAEAACGTAGTKAEGAACGSATECQDGLVCACGGEGAAKFGAECAATGGTCAKGCFDWERGPNSSCGAGKICTGAALPSLYSYCAGPVVTPDAGATDAGTPDATP